MFMSYHVKPNINGSALLAKKRAANPELSLLGSGSTTGVPGDLMS